MKQLQANWTSQLVPFGPATLDCLDRNGSMPGAFMISSFSKDGTVGWVTRGRALEVFSTGTGHRVAAWSFGAILKEPSTVITAVAEYYYDSALRLLVATTTSSAQTGMICIFDVKTSQVLKAVELPYKVTALESIVGVGPDQPATHVLSEHLRNFCGVVAIGTHHGHVYLLDLNLDDDTDSCDEIQPNSVFFLDPRVKDVAGCRFKAISKHKHLCMELDDESHQRGYYYFRKPDSSVVKTFSAEDVCVSSLSYIRQTATLAVGFSFGCFQLWGLYIPVLEYTSRMDDFLAPITHFAYQEPENDPRNFVYIWAARGPRPMDSVEEHTASMSLFQLGYSKKVWYDGLGFVYEELQSVGPRFEHELSTSPSAVADDDNVGSRIVSCYTIQDPHFTLPERSESEDSFDEGGYSADLSLCVFVWEAAPADPHARSQYQLALFDMNRWYHAQMPHTFRYSSLSNDSCSFLAFYALDGISEACTPDNIMALHVNHSSVAKYCSSILPPPEQHFYPTSLAFDAACVTETGLVHSKFLGLQRQIMSDLERGGPQVMLDPTHMYNMCLYAGLLPRTTDNSISANVSIVEKRSSILNVALQHNLLSFITACVYTWAAGEYTSAGCTLRYLLDWAWASITNIKSAIDRICVSLYDWSGVQLDSTAMALLHHHQVGLQHASSVLASLASVNTATTDRGQRDLDTKLNVVRLIENHIGAVVWCYTEGLLPEVSEEDVATEGRYGYPQKALTGFYSQRRQNIERLNSEMRGTELLLIDGLVNQAGDPLHNLLEKEGNTALYPPSSLHTVLNMYLLDGVPLTAKHTIFYYLLCDLMYLTPEESTEKFEEKMHHFAQAFCLPYTTIRLVQGFWHLDHRQFEEAMYFLLDPIIRSELCPWQHTRIIKALLYQGHHKMALKYMRIKKPGMLTAEDVKLRLTVLLANGLTSEAFEYQRICRDQLNTEDLLSHLFLGCQQTRTMDQLLQLPMTADEERHLLSHMRTSTEPNSEEVLVLHYLQRSRIIEALQRSHRLKHSTLADIDTAARERAVARHSIIDCYQRVLPKAQRKMAFGIEPAIRKPGGTRREVVRPVPLSTFVNRAKRTQAVSHATLISAVLNKVREVREESEGDMQPSASHQVAAEVEPEEPGPFIGTPVIPKSRSKINETAEVVFPSMSQQIEASPCASPQKRPYSSPLSCTRMEESFLPVEFTTKRMDRRVSSAAALSLLHTPPVRRKTPPTRARLSAPPSASTPQSILKVRHTVRRSPSPTKKPNMTLSDLCLPTPPRLHRRLNMSQPTDPVVASTVEASASAATPTSTGTPKQLRFSVPASPASPPDSGDQVGPASAHSKLATPRDVLRSVRDRSPTPERMSPKSSPNLDIVREGERRSFEGMEMEDEQEDKSDVEAMEVNQEVDRVIHQVSEEQDSEGLEDNDGDMEEDYLGEESIRTVLTSDATVALSQTHLATGKSYEEQEETSSSEAAEDEEEEEEEANVSVIEIQGSLGKDSNFGAVTRTVYSETRETRRSVSMTTQPTTTTPKILGTMRVINVITDSCSEEEDSFQLRISSESDDGNMSRHEEEVNGGASSHTSQPPSQNIPCAKICEDTAVPQGLEEERDRHKNELLKLSLSAPEFKTPPRPSRLSTLPPTPPESGQGTPPHEVSPPKVPSELEIPSSAHDTPKARTSRRSVAAGKKGHAVEESSASAHGTRSQAKTDADVPLETQEPEPTTPTRGSRATKSKTGSKPNTPTRSKGSQRASTPPRSTRSKAGSPAHSLPDTTEHPMETSMSTRSKATRDLTPDSLVAGGERNSMRVTRSRVRTDSRSTVDSHGDQSDSVSVNSSTPSRRLRGRRGSTDSESSDTLRHDTESISGSIPGQVTPPRSEEQELEVNVRATRSGGRPRASTPPRTTPTRTPKVTTPTRSSRRLVEVNNAGNEKEGEGPLSSGSFMMGLRSRRSISRETTPESSRPSDLGSEVASEVSSVVTEEDLNERSNFTFSEPMAVDTSKVAAEEPTNAAQSFIFSPPLTRTRSLRSRSQGTTPTAISPLAKVKAISILPENPSKDTAKRTKKSKKTSPVSSDSPINLLTPPTKEELEEWAEGSSWQRAKGRGVGKRVMTLRPKKVSSKKKPPLELW